MLTLKQKIQNFFLPLGSVQTIRRGYLKGHKLKITENSLWSPILGGWEPAMQKIMANVVRENMIAYDLGANNGLHGLLMARLAAPKGLVYNFEPLPENIVEIDENFTLNGISNYKNVQAAVSNAVGTVTFELSHHAKQGHIDNTAPAAGGHSITVPTITMDSFIEAGNPAPHFIKIDIEGAEADALAGYSKHIADNYPDLIIELHSREQDLRVGKFLSEHGYQAFRFDPFKKLHFTPVQRYDLAYPDPAGIWGTIFCIGPNKKLDQYSFLK